MSTHTQLEITDLPTLIQAVEEMFDCQMGGPGRYVFLGDESKYTDRFTYKTLMLGVKGHNPRHLQAMRMSMGFSFEKLHDLAGGRRPVLYWRHTDKITEERQGATDYIRARVAIPAVPEPWPEWLYKKEGAPAPMVA